MNAPMNPNGAAPSTPTEDWPEAISESDELQDDLADFDYEFDEDVDAQFGEPWDPDEPVIGDDVGLAGE